MHGEVNIKLHALTSSQNKEKRSASWLGHFNPDEVTNGIHWTYVWMNDR